MSVKWTHSYLVHFTDKLHHELLPEAEYTHLNEHPHSPVSNLGNYSAVAAGDDEDKTVNNNYYNIHFLNYNNHNGGNGSDKHK